jgi:predicted PurR-regulated permease PerM
LARWASDHSPLSYRWAYWLVVVAFVAAVSTLVYSVGSHLPQQADLLWKELRSAAENLADRARDYQWAQRYLEGSAEGQAMLTKAGGILAELFRGMQSMLWAITGLAVIFFVGVYLAFEPELYVAGLLKLVSERHRDHAAEVLEELTSTLSRWILGRLISMALVGISTAVAMWILGVPLPGTLGVVAGLLTFIPNIGPILAAVPQALLALQVGTETALYVILFNIALQAVESYLFTPLIQKYEVQLPPALTIIVQLFMAVLAGTIGIMMAAPLTAATMVLVRTVYLQKQPAAPPPS